VPALYDYKLHLQHPAMQLALQRLVDRELAHRETIATALKDAAVMVMSEETRGRFHAALRAVEASAGDEGELRKVAAKLREVVARRKRAVIR
jgi:hypothetical protein